MMPQYTVYLLHFRPAYKDAGHYIGIARTDRLQKRFDEHARGVGASLTRAAIAAGCELHVVRTWGNASFWFEAHLKRNSHFKLLCPVCSTHIDTGIETRYAPIVAPNRRPPPASHKMLSW